LSGSEARRVLETIAAVQAGRLERLAEKKLKGASGHYRVRVGRVRILFTKINNRNIITGVDFRNDNTY